MGTVTTKNNMEFDKRIKELLKGIRVSESDIQGKLDKVQEIGLSPIRVCSYGRVSTKSDEQESSLVNQHTIFNNYCDRQLENGWVLAEEVFDQKTGTLMANRRTIFSTKIKCEVCGCSYTRIKGGYGNRLCSYYVCAGRRNKDLRGKVHECTNSMTYRQDELLDCLEQYMLQILTNKNKIKSIVRKVVTNIHKEMEASIDNYKLSWSYVKI